MMKIRCLSLCLLGALFLPLESSACECAFSPLSDETVRTAKRIVVFQLVSAELTDDSTLGEGVIAKLRVTNTLLGDAPDILQAQYSTFWCCGSRLDVGHKYVLFDSVGVDPVYIHEGNLLPLGDELSSDQADIERLRRVLSFEASLESEFGQYPSGELSQVPPPPAPCPQSSAQ